MKVQMQSVHFTADQTLLDFIQKRLDKLETFYDRIVEGEVIMRLSNEGINNKIVEVKLFVPGATLFSQESAGSFEAAADSAAEQLKKQLIRYKEKQVAH